jgi:TolB-like protein
VIVLLCIGFIIAVFVSWIYDITPEGVKKTKPVSAIKHSDQSTDSTSSGWKIATYVSAVVIIVLVTLNFISRGNLNVDISKFEKSIAVLPFQNLSNDKEQLWFSDGITDIIINQLSKISSLRVLGRTSILRYREEQKSIPEIGKELGVNYIIEGTVQRQENKMRISVQIFMTGSGKTYLKSRMISHRELLRD